MNRSRILDAVQFDYRLIAILAVALVIRLALAVYVQRTVDASVPPQLCLITGDAEGYWELAQKIAASKDYAIFQPPRYVLRVPGFSAILAVSQIIFGDNPLPARCLLACIGTLACGLTFWLGRELVDSETGLIAAAYTAVSPTQALFSVLILSETAFGAALLLSLIAIARGVQPFLSEQPLAQVFRRAVVTGILIGTATLVRPTWLYVGFLIAVGVTLTFWDWTFKALPRFFLVCLGFILGTVVCLAPWICRNYIVTRHFVPTTLWVGASLYDGLRPGATGDSDMKFVEVDNLLGRMSEYEMDRVYRERAWEFVFEYPGQTVHLALLKQMRYWSLVPNAAQFQRPALKWVVLIAVIPLMVFAASGFWVARRNPRLIILTFGPVLLFAAMHLLFVGSLRYRLPAEFPMAVAAAIGFRSILPRYGPRLAPDSSGEGTQ